jgi:glucokinase
VVEVSVSRFWRHPLGLQPPVLGIEIGGHGQRVVVADGSGRIHGQARATDGKADALTTVVSVQRLAEQACAEAGVSLATVEAAGIAFGGPVDPHRGLTLLSHRAPGFEQFPLVALLEERLGLPAVLDNDARAAALGEAAFGAGRGCQNVVYVHLATGVGGGIIVDGRLLYGTSNTAGEIGHMVVSSGGPLCSCGKPGHLEAYAAAPSIQARVRERLAELPHDPAHAVLTRRQPSLKQIFQSASASPAVEQVVRETVQTLGLAIANLVTVLNPEAVILGGPVTEVGSLLMDPLQARVRQYAYPASLRSVRLTTAELGSDASILGAVALALAHSGRV